MTANDCVEKIKQSLIEAFSPTYLSVVDESAQHHGHKGAIQHGGGHYHVTITAPLFSDKSLLESHRMIYQTLEDLMKNDIHALRITVI